MGAISGLLGVGGGAAGTGFGGPSQADQTGMRNMQYSFDQLKNVASGQGPNPAMAQYNQNVQDLAKQQSGAISSVQGISPALAARMASQQGSGAMQNAAAAGATAQAQQQLGAMGQMGNIGAQMQGSSNAMQQNMNNVNSGLAQTTMQGQQGLMGGLMNGAGAAMKLFADGGAVPMAGGGLAPMSSFTQFLQSRAQAPAESAVEPTQQLAPVSGFSQGLGGYGKQKTKVETSPAPGATNMGQGPTMANMGQPVAAIPYSQPQMYGAAPMAGGGKVPAMLSPGEKYIPPGKVGQAAASANPLAAGKTVPGKPKVAGNSYSNDVVPAKLDTGGIVIPNSIMQSKNPEKGAHDFISNIIAKRKVAWK